MKISLKLANGATLEFEGDQEEFDRVSAFLAEPPDSLTAEGPPGNPAAQTPEAENQPDDESLVVGSLDPSAVWDRLQKVGAANDQERVTVMAQLAVESGEPGVDYRTIEELYTELGLAKPAQFPAKTFSNAKASGLVKLVKPGLWKPTFRGENFGRGLGRTERGTRRGSARSKASNNQGGESD